MKISKAEVFVAAVVLAVAAGKTAVVSAIFLDAPDRSAAVVALLFILFTAMTGVAAMLVLGLARRMLDQKRLGVKATAIGVPGKENLVEAHAMDWGLSRAETDIAVLVVKGFSNAEIAAMRGSVVATVKSQLGAIYDKSGLQTRYQLISFITDEVCEMSRTAALQDIEAMECAAEGFRPEPAAPTKEVRATAPKEEVRATAPKDAPQTRYATVQQEA